MNHIIRISLAALIGFAAPLQAFGWGTVTGPRGGTATTGPRGAGYAQGPNGASAAIVPFAISSTYVKSRSCEPSPNTVTGAPSAICLMKRKTLISGRPIGP